MVQSLYHLSDDAVKDLTLKEFYIKQKNIPKVAQLYNPYIGSGEEENKQQNNDALIKMISKSKHKKIKGKK